MAVGDPVGAGIVESLDRPGRNVTGLSDLAAHLQGNRLQLLREIAPAASLFSVLLNPGTPYAALAYIPVEQVRACRQSQDGQSLGPHRPVDDHGTRRRRH